MTSRLMPEADKSLCDAVAVLDPSTWASDSLSPEFGERELRLLCETLSCSFSEMKVAYRDFKECGGKTTNLVLQSLLNRVNTIPVSTSECERGFSNMYVVCSKLRTRLTINHMSALLFISLSEPSVKLFNPLRYVKSWLSSNRREAKCKQCLKKRDAMSETTKEE